MTAEEFDREEAAAAESLALTFGIQDAGSWDAYKRLRDGRPEIEMRESA